MQPKAPLFNAHHSPMGAWCTLTLGYPGASGGFGMGLGRPANEPIFIGYEDEPDHFVALPFFDGCENDAARYQVEGAAAASSPGLRPVGREVVTREFGFAMDTWQFGPCTFTIHSPFRSAPDPRKTDLEVLRDAYAPVLRAELTLDNRQGSEPKRVFFGHRPQEDRDHTRLIGSNMYAVGRRVFVAMEPGPATSVGLGFSPEMALAHARDGVDQYLGENGMVVGTVPAGEIRTFRLVFVMFRDEIITTNPELKLFYASLFGSGEELVEYGFATFDAAVERGARQDVRLATSGLSEDQQFLLAHSVRSYVGCTELLGTRTQPIWVVNEGEYRMMNTFDLAVDQMPFELAHMPWVVGNILQQFVDRYSYQDETCRYGSTERFPGGLSFAHDMGVGDQWSPPGRSSYERPGLTDCFSYMTHEQVVNWVLCARSYQMRTNQNNWNLDVLKDCLQSLVNRDAARPEDRDGLMDLESSRCEGGAEITTYDSLDISLGQSRRNLYLAVKTWAAYLGLSSAFAENELPDLAQLAQDQAMRAASTLLAARQEDGTFPAVLEGANPSVIIPAVEGLIYPLLWSQSHLLESDGPYGDLTRALGEHLNQVLNDGRCRFEDGGWKLSSTSNNSWLSKIFLCQCVQSTLFPQTDMEREVADAAHVEWLTRPASAYWCFSDQMVSGTAQGSRYYPRGVTAWLWWRGGPLD